jgi:hypothetical protein
MGLIAGDGGAGEGAPPATQVKRDAYYDDACDGERLGSTSGHNFSPLEHAAEVVGLANRHAFGPQDCVGRGNVEVEVRQQNSSQVRLARE